MTYEPKVPPSNVYVPGQSHQVLADWVKTGEQADAEGLAQTWQDWGNGLQEASRDLFVAVFGSQDGWTGQAANAMREQLRRVAEWSKKTGEGFNKASTAFTQQGEAVGTAKNAMPEPVNFSPEQMIKDAAKGGIIDLIKLPGAMYEQHQKQQQAYEQAIQVVAQRDAALQAAASSVPPFEPPPKVGDGGIKEPPPNNPPMPGSSGFRPGTGGTGSRGQFAGGGGSGGGGAGGGGSIPGFNGGNGFGPNDPNNPNGNDQNTPPNVNIPGMPIGTGTSGYNPGPPPSTNFGGGNPNPFAAGPTAAGGGGNFGGAFGGGFGPGGAPRPGGGFGPLGSGTAAGAQGPGAGAPPPGAGMGGGRGAAGAGRGGMGAGGMGGGAGRGEGGEDEEHQRPSYLVEPDPDATFGTDQLTAPPVIGG
ncbi:hypothetical protein [Kibdelosporangium aridum]|uniref:hypothetical protein n=1 Tax=Kibdelosporangium aridum TaxID=2030 RepID=UPI000A9CC1D6|nr:hypothetical protein [Kibdelosporangium aridum]